MIKIPRISRKDIKTPFMHLMVQGVNKEHIFKDNKYIEKYLELLKKFNEEYKEITILAYCIMNNHAHLLVHTENIEQIGKYMHKVNLIYSQFYNKENNRCGVVFRNRFKTEPIYNLKYLANCIRYIHMNPVKAKMVESPEKYAYSSAREYMSNGPITQSKIMQNIFGSNMDYSKIFNGQSQYMFIDERQYDYDEIKTYMDIAIKEFLNDNNIELCETFENREILKGVIKHLHKKCRFKYKDIEKRFLIPASTMRSLK